MSDFHTYYGVALNVTGWYTAEDGPTPTRVAPSSKSHKPCDGPLACFGASLRDVDLYRPLASAGALVGRMAPLRSYQGEHGAVPEP